MALISSTGHATWGFELPPIGWQTVVIHEKTQIGMSKGDPDNPDKKPRKMMTVAMCVGGESQNHSQYCMLDNLPGLRSVIDLVVATGLHEVIKKEKSLDLIAGVDEELIKSDKFLNYICAKLVGRRFEANGLHKMKKNQKGEDREYYEMKDIRPLENSKASSSVPTTAGKVAEEEGW